MAGQITWRNVDQRPTTADAALMFRSASTQMNQGLDDIGGLFKSAEAVQANNVRAADEVGKQNYLDVLQTAKTPEELAALQADPATAALRASLGVKARNDTRGAEEARTTALRAQETAALAFNNARLDAAEKPIRDELDALALTNPEAARVRAQQYQTEGKLRSVAPVFKEAQAAQEQAFRWGRTQLDATNADIDRARKVNVLQPAEDAARDRATKIADLQLTESQRVAAEQEAARTNENAFATAAAAHQAKQVENLALIGKEAAVFGQGAGDVKLTKKVPLKPDGTVDRNKMTDEDLAKFDLYLSRKKMPTLSDLAVSDTNAAQAARNAIIQSGKATPAVLAKLDGLAPTLFSTAAPTKIGNTAEEAALNQRLVDAADKKLEDEFGAVNSQGQRDKLREAGMKFIEQMRDPKIGSKESWIRGFNEWLTKGGGLVVDKKTGETVLPSESKMLELMGTIDTGMNAWSTEYDIKKVLEKGWDQNPKAREGALKLYENKLTNRQRAVELLSPKKDEGSKKK